LNCYYCDKFHAADDTYAASPATRDLGSDAPRCDKHWRYICAKCGNPSHFIGTSFCTETNRFFCSNCATESEEIDAPTWGWAGHDRHRSPWSGEWEPALDRLEFIGNHSFADDALRTTAASAISGEQMLTRYPSSGGAWRESREFSDDEVQQNWNTNAVRWDEGYDDDGDRNRRYQSDEPMLEALGHVSGLNVLDIGSGNGYLSRKLARAGASLTGVELSDESSASQPNENLSTGSVSNTTIAQRPISVFLATRRWTKPSATTC